MRLSFSSPYTEKCMQVGGPRSEVKANHRLYIGREDLIRCRQTNELSHD